MNSRTRLAWHYGLIVLVFLLGAGCATNKINWSTRVGIYTYDQAVLEMGPPDKSAKLEDNTVIADWVLQRGHYESWSNGGTYPYGFGPGVYPGYSTIWMPDFFLRLTFGPDKKLQSWKKFTR